MASAKTFMHQSCRSDCAVILAELTLHKAKRSSMEGDVTDFKESLTTWLNSAVEKGDFDEHSDNTLAQTLLYHHRGGGKGNDRLILTNDILRPTKKYPSGARRFACQVLLPLCLDEVGELVDVFEQATHSLRDKIAAQQTEGSQECTLADSQVLSLPTNEFMSMTTDCFRNFRLMKPTRTARETGRQEKKHKATRNGKESFRNRLFHLLWIMQSDVSRPTTLPLLDDNIWRRGTVPKLDKFSRPYRNEDGTVKPRVPNFTNIAAGAREGGDATRVGAF